MATFFCQQPRAAHALRSDEKKRKERPGLADDTLQLGGEEEGGEQHHEQHPQVVGGGAVLILKERIEMKQKENASIFIKKTSTNISKIGGWRIWRWRKGEEALLELWWRDNFAVHSHTKG